MSDGFLDVFGAFLFCFFLCDWVFLFSLLLLSCLCSFSMLSLSQQKGTTKKTKKDKDLREMSGSWGPPWLLDFFWGGALLVANRTASALATFSFAKHSTVT